MTKESDATTPANAAPSDPKQPTVENTAPTKGNVKSMVEYFEKALNPKKTENLNATTKVAEAAKPEATKDEAESQTKEGNEAKEKSNQSASVETGPQLKRDQVARGPDPAIAPKPTHKWESKVPTQNDKPHVINDKYKNSKAGFKQADTTQQANNTPNTTPKTKAQTQNTEQNLQQHSQQAPSYGQGKSQGQGKEQKKPGAGIKKNLLITTGLATAAFVLGGGFPVGAALAGIIIAGGLAKTGYDSYRRSEQKKAQQKAAAPSTPNNAPKVNEPTKGQTAQITKETSKVNEPAKGQTEQITKDAPKVNEPTKGQTAQITKETSKAERSSQDQSKENKAPESKPKNSIVTAMQRNSGESKGTEVSPPPTPKTPNRTASKGASL